MRKEIAMTIGSKPILQQLAGLSSAEEFLEFFEIAYIPSVVHVNRLHILKRWHQYIEHERTRIEALTEGPARDRYRILLQKAHDDFVVSNAAAEKVFKVFQDADGPRFALADLSATLPSRTKLPPAR